MTEIPQGLVAATQEWVNLRDERARLSDGNDGELDYDTTRQFEEAQEDAATSIADMTAGWLAELGLLR